MFAYAQVQLPAHRVQPGRPWLVLGSERRTVELEAGVSFIDYAREQSPEPRWTVQLDPGELSPERFLSDG
jgi:hypothetical protein